MSHTGSHRADLTARDEEPTLGRLVADASRDMSALVHSEIALAKSELKVSLTTGGIGAGLLAAAAFLGMVALVLLSVTIAYFLVWAGLGPWWAFLIVTVFYLLLAGILALLGLRRIKRVRGPERTIATTKQIPQALKPS
ncbi:MAG: phage holin family protein [Nocardioidaceae bacterium]